MEMFTPLETDLIQEALELRIIQLQENLNRPGLKESDYKQMAQDITTLSSALNKL